MFDEEESILKDGIVGLGLSSWDQGLDHSLLARLSRNSDTPQVFSWCYKEDGTGFLSLGLVQSSIASDAALEML